MFLIGHDWLLIHLDERWEADEQLGDIGGPEVPPMHPQQGLCF